MKRLFSALVAVIFMMPSAMAALNETERHTDAHIHGHVIDRTTGKMLVEHHAGMIEANTTVETPDFWDLGFKASYNFRLWQSCNLQLNAGVQNIFNSFQRDFDYGADRDSGYIYGPTLPRCFYFGIKLTY